MLRTIGSLIAAICFLSFAPIAQSAESPCFSNHACGAGTLTQTTRSMMEGSCSAVRASNCKDIKDSSKLYSCDLKAFCNPSSLDQAIAGSTGCALGLWDGTGGMVVDAVKGIASLASNAAECNASYERKLEMIDRLNQSLPPGESFQTPPLENLKRTSCGELFKMLQLKAELVARRVPAKSASSPSAASATQNESAKQKSVAERILDQFKVRRECYNTQALAEMYCEAGAFAAMTVVPGAMALRAARAARIAELAGTPESAAAVGQFANAGKVSLSTAGALSDADRIKVAESILGRALTHDQESALIAAHKVGQSDHAGFFTYTEDQLRQKAKILRDAGFTSQERSILMRNGIAGSSTNSSSVAASLQQTKTFKMLPPWAQNERLRALQLRDRAVRDYEYLGSGPNEQHALAAADATRIAGETAGSVGDLGSSRALLKEAVARYEKISLKSPGLMSDGARSEELFRVRVRAGDIEKAAKSISEAPTASRSSASERFNQLAESAQEGPPRSVLDNETGRGRNLETGQPIPATNASSYYYQQLQQLRTVQRVLQEKPSWLNTNVNPGRIQSSIDSVIRELRGRGYNVDELLK